MKRLEKARKKAEAICETVDVSEKEKMNQIKRYEDTATELQEFSVSSFL